MYSESSNFRKAYEYAKLFSDKIFILSAKYGLLEEADIIDTYNFTLNDQSVSFRQEWTEKVVNLLEQKTDIANDSFIILAGLKYNEFLIKSLSHYVRPLLGKSQGFWSGALDNLINQAKTEVDAITLHELFSVLPKYDYANIKDIPIKNGIYIMFEKDELFENHKRIVRVGTHTSQDNLKSRLKSHFSNHQRSSIFRRNIGRIYVSQDNPSYLKVWNSKNDNPSIDKHYEKLIERDITDYLKGNITFAVFSVIDKGLRLRLEDGIISTLNKDDLFKASQDWLGNKSPKAEIATSGLWCVNGLNAEILTKNEFYSIKQLIAGNENEVAPLKKVIAKPKVVFPLNSDNNKSVLSKMSKADKIRQYIYAVIENAKSNGETYVDLISGDIHRDLGLSKNHHNVCRVMYSIKGYKQETVYSTPSGYSSTIKIRYYI